MKSIQSIYKIQFFLVGLLLMVGCTREFEDLEPLTFPVNPNVFIDGFTGDLQYSAFGGSDVTAFQVDNQVTFNDTEASMRFEVPDEDSPDGAFAGGAFFSTSGRDLSGFNALTFYIRASQAVNIGELGFGNDLGENKYVTTISDFPANTNWQKVIIPIPNPSVLTGERGLLFFSSGAVNGRGYTFWIDEVKYENLSDLGEVTGLILGGADTELNDAETGQTYIVDGLGAKALLPNGVNQVVNASNNYFSFASSNPTIAGVDSMGVVSVIDSGTTVITGFIGGKLAQGSLQLTSIGAPVGPTEPAPTPPARDPATVVSLYSNAYDNVPIGTWNARYQFSNANEFFVQIDGDDVIRYRDLNFVGIEFFTPTVDASAMNTMHMDIWTPDPTTDPNNFKILLADLGVDGVFGGDNDSNFEVTINSSELSSNAWVSLDIPLSSFSGLNARDNLGQMVLSGSLPNVYMDNVYFYQKEDENTAPTTAAPDPTTPAEDVLSIFSDSYTDVSGTNFNPDWGQSGFSTATQIDLDGNAALAYPNFNYQGFDLGSSQDVTGFDFLHIDYFSSDADALNAFLISSGGVETSVSLTVPTTGWGSIDIALSEFASVVDLSDVIQFKFDGGDGSKTIYLDNVYFYKSASTTPIVPTVAAPTPTQAPENVLSIFSDVYTDVAGTDYNPNWGQAGFNTASQLDIAGNNTLSYPNFNYQGIQLGSSQDASGFEFLHIDFYSANSDALSAFLISMGPVETAFALNVPTSGWGSVDIPLSSFAPVDLADVIQMKFEGGDGSKDVFFDNIYFWKNAAASIVPTIGAPVPTQAGEDVLSIFSDTYSDLPGTNFNPNWGQAGFNTAGQVDIAGNNTLAYPNFNYQGFELAGSQDVSGFEFLHIDFYSANADALNAFLISPGGVETAFALTVPTNGWSSVDIPLSSFAPVDLADVIQFKFDGGDGAKDIYLDNIYFWKSAGGGGNTCPAPPAGEFITDGDFEANADCWEFFAFQDGTSSGIVTNESNGGGSNSARIQTARAANPAIKQSRFGIGEIQPNTTYVVTFDIRSDANDPLVASAVLNAFTFSEPAEGSSDAAVQHVLVGGDPNVPSTWTTRTYTFTTAANVDGGVSILIELVTGAVDGASGTVFIDNVSLTAQ